MTDPFINPAHVQGSEAWLAHRKNHIGASESAIIMGISPWQTPMQLWENKLGLGKEQEENFYMRRGTEMEPLAREAFQVEHGIDVFPQVVYHSEHRFLMASLDGLSLDGNTCVEIKCPGEKTHAMALAGKIPPHYMSQLQHQMACTGLDKMIYYSFDGRNGVSIEVARDDDFIEKMIAKEIKFWDCVKSKKAPSFTDRDFEKRDGPLWNSVDRRLLEIERELEIYKELLEEKDALRDSLIMDADGRSCMGGSIKLSHSFTKGSIKYDSIPELEGVDLEKYRSAPRERWTLTLKKEKK